MSYRDQWKMLHLLNTSKKGRLSADELREMGVDCYNDTVLYVKQQNLVLDQYGEYTLHPVVMTLMNQFLLMQGPTDMKEIYVDTPECFVVMPFSEPWSAEIYEFIKNALEEAAIKCVRGDMIPRVGKLSDNIVKKLQKAGLVVAEITSPNPNVYYELGLADMMGRDVFLLFDKNAEQQLPADIQGAHYYAYDKSNLPQSHHELVQHLLEWKTQNCVDATLKHCG